MRINDSQIGRLGIEPRLVRTRVGFLESERIENGLVSSAERAFERVHGVPGSHAMTGYSNGTDALIGALEALDIGYGDSVIVPGLTWQATAGAVLDVNAVPILLDVEPGTLCLDPGKVEAYLEECVAGKDRLPRAIIVVHMFNRAANMDRFPEIARRFGVFLIEDCAHAHGARWRGRALGTFGAIGTFSTQRTKPLSGLKRDKDDRWASPTGSEGGFILTGVPTLDIRVRALQSCGRKVDVSQIDPDAKADELTAYWRGRVDELELDVFPLQSGNNRLPGSVAERLLDQLQRFDAEHEQRLAGIAQIEDALRAVPGIQLLPHQEQLTRPNAHMFAFGFDRAQFAGMDSALFRQVLMLGLDGYLVDAPYNPLGGGPAGYHSPVYNPHTKQRYRLNDEHWAAIDPHQWSLPAAHDAYDRIVVLENIALGEDGIAPALAATVNWTRDNATTVMALAS